MTLKISQLAAAASVLGTELVEVSKLSLTVIKTATTISALSSDNSINDSGAGWIASGFAVGDQVRIQGFTGNVVNNIFSARITVLTTAKMTFGGTDGEVIVDDAAGESVTVTKWESKRCTVADLVASVSAVTSVAGLTFTSDTGSTADADNSAGFFWWNNATQASATTLFFDNLTADAVGTTTYFASLASSGFIYVQQCDDSMKWQLWKWTAVTAGSGYYKFTVTLQAMSGSIADNKTIYAQFLGAGAGSASTTGKHAIWIAAGSMTPSATGGCAYLANIASAANQPDIQSLDFDSTTQEFAQFSVTMPKSWDEGTVTFAPVWSHAATTTNFGVVWQLQGVAVSDGDAIAVAYGAAQTSTDAGGTTNTKYTGPESSAITIAGTPAAGDTVFFRAARNPADGSDTMAIDARLMGIVLFITTDAGNDA